MSADPIARGLAAQARATALAPSLAGPRGNSNAKPLVRQLANTAAMIARVRANAGSGSIALLGDSTSFGTGASGRTQDYAHRLASILTAAGVPAETDSLWGVPAGFTLASLATYDTRFTTSGGWTGGAAKSLAGVMFGNSTDTAAITFTPEKPVNLFTIWYPADGQFGSFSIQVDSGPVQTVSQSAYGGVWSVAAGVLNQTTAPAATTGLFGKATLRLDTTAAHTLRIARVSGNVQITGFHGYRSDLSQVAILPWGRPGETAPNWAAGTNGAWGYLSATGPGVYLKPELTLIDLGINDGNTGVTPAAFQTAMQALIGVPLAAGRDAALMVPVPTNPAQIALATQQAIRARIEALSVANGVPVIADLPARWGEYAGGNALGYYPAGESVHPGDAGYADKAQAVARVLLGL